MNPDKITPSTPVTPVVSHVESFRRPSCSSNSSLYDTSNFYSDDDAFYDDTEFEILSTPKLSIDLKSPSIKFRNDFNFSPPKESTPIFKRIINKSKPQLKSFKRVTKELQKESNFIQNEINNENLILKQNKLLNGFSPNNQSLKKFDLIKKANQSWNKKSNVKNSDIFKNNKLIRKRSNDESTSNFKRRAVSSSPSSFLKKK